MNAIEQAIRSANAAGRPALAPFLTAGFPRREGFANLLEAVAREADLVEIGVPFSDPMADGVTIQRSSRIALEDDVSVAWILEMLGERTWSAPLVLMSYLNPLLRYGIQRLAARASAAGVRGLIVPDLPYEESAGVRRTLDDAGVGLVQLVTPLTPPGRLTRLGDASRGFVYAVTVTGITGGQAPRNGAVAEYLDRVRQASPVPVLAGFGIRTPEQLRSIAAHADGAIVGSALIEILERNKDPVEFLRGLRGETE